MNRPNPLVSVYLVSIFINQIRLHIFFFVYFFLKFISSLFVSFPNQITFLNAANIFVSAV